jgi:Flp pilus assembly protein TadD
LGSDRTTLVATLLAIPLLAAGLYADTLAAPFVYDDRPNIEGNRSIRIRGFGAAELQRAGFDSATLRPVSNLSFALNYYFSEYDPAAYRAVNIAIHGANGVLVYLLALKLLTLAARNRGRGRFPPPDPRAAALLAALIFIAHPIQIQSVTYVVQRMNSLATLFYLLSILLFLGGRTALAPRRRAAVWGGCLGAWLLALGSKEIAATLPFALILIEWTFFRDPPPIAARRDGAYLGAAALTASLVGWVYLRTSAGSYADFDFTVGERLLTQLRVVSFYASLLVFPLPSRLSLIHDFPVSRSLLDPVTTLLSLIFLAALLGAAIARARRERVLSFCVVWFFLHLLIESTVVPLHMAFEHRLYLPLFGFSLAASCLLLGSMRRHRAVAAVVTALLLCGLAAATLVGNRVWQSRVALWSDVVHKNPHDSRAHYNLGTALVSERRFEQAGDQFIEALRIDPDYGPAHNGLGMTREGQLRLEEAIDHYERALRAGDLTSNVQGIVPDEVTVRTNLAFALERLGRSAEAARHFERALARYPESARAHHGMGLVLAGQGHLDEAYTHFAEAVRLEPADANARNDLAVALTRLERLEDAKAQYREVLRSRPADVRAHIGLGLAPAQQGRFEPALAHFEAALRSDPGNAEATRLRAAALRRLPADTPDASGPP